MDSTTYSILEPDVRTAAKTAARTWPGVIEEDDAEQEIWLRILEAGMVTQDKLVGMDRPLRVSSLTEIGHQIGARYRDEFEYFSGNFTYGTRQVRDMLERDALGGVDEDSNGPLWELPETVIKQIERTDTETVTERIDLFIGMARLVKKNARYAFLIQEAYVRGNFEADDSKGKSLTRAVDALTREMNSINRQRRAEFSDGPGTRKAISNERAQTITRNDYNR